MAAPNDVRESFPTTEAVGTSVGVALTSMSAGQATAGAFGAIGFAFQDINGNAVLPQLNNLGQLPVTLSTSGQRARATGRVPGNVLTVPASGDYTGYVQVLSIPLVASANMGDFAGKVSCRRGAMFELVYQDSGGTSLVLDSTIVESGQYTAPLALGPAEDTFVVPASASAPALVVRAGNFQVASDLHATLAVTTF